jgi:hypothetical protein
VLGLGLGYALFPGDWDSWAQIAGAAGGAVLGIVGFAISTRFRAGAAKKTDTPPLRLEAQL